MFKRKPKASSYPLKVFLKAQIGSQIGWFDEVPGHKNETFLMVSYGFTDGMTRHYR